MSLFDAAEALGSLIEGGFGFRYLLSREYRKRVHERWAENSRVDVALEIFQAAIGMVVLGVIVWVVFELLTS